MTRPHADLDLATHLLWQRAAEPMLRTLWADPTLRILERLDTKNQAIRRFSDTAALVQTASGRVIAHTEFEADPRPAAFARRMHTYGNLLYGLHNGRYPVRSTAVVLGGTRPVPTLHEVRHDGEVLSLYRFRVWRIDEVPAAQIADDPALAALVPLARGATEELFARAVRCVRRAWTEADAADVLGALYITGCRSFGLNLVTKLIREEEIMLSPGYTHIFNKGVAQGEERGLERGLRQATAHFRDRLARQATLRFGDSAAIDDLLPRLNAEDLDVLSEQILLCDSAGALRAVMLERLRGR